MQYHNSMSQSVHSNISCVFCFFLSSFQSRDGAFPAELWLGVSREAISVYKRGEPWPLEVFPYEQILSFGAPLPNAYKIAVEGRELLFETQMVGIAQLMFLLNCCIRSWIATSFISFLLFFFSAGHGHRQAHEGLH